MPPSRVQCDGSARGISNKDLCREMPRGGGAIAHRASAVVLLRDPTRFYRRGVHPRDGRWLKGARDFSAVAEPEERATGNVR